MNKAIVNRLKKISIRGRMALGIKCLEMKLEILETSDKETISKLLSTLWEFTNSKQLDLWEEKILDFEPESLIESFENNNIEDFKYLDITEVKKYYKLYKYEEFELTKMVSWAIDIGRGNLYGGTGEYSESTLNSTIEMLKIIEKNNLQIPDLSIFEKSKYSEFHGWGFEREKSFFE